MSKISLEPNDSGAGTFSIVSPDSNTNRTLNLPDEAGTILSDASTIDSNNLQSDVYKQDNILGTVSESGGVPTGAIIERGSNSNGEFVRYADGTLICFKIESLSSLNTGAKISTFPSTFNNDPKMANLTIHTESSSNGNGVSVNLHSAGVTDTRVRYRVHPGVTTDGDSNPRLHIMAIGRWY